MDNTPNEKNKTKRNTSKIIVLSLFFILLFILVFGGYYIFSFFDDMKIENLNKDNASLGIQDSSIIDNVLNIALFGVDQREAGERGRSDSIMIASIDKKHSKIKLVSIMRDSYVDIEGHGKDKLNHAYAFGGPQLAIKTLNQNYNLAIKDYAAVNFADLAHIIDAIGGIEMDIQSYELTEVNKYINDVSLVTGLPATPLEKTGKQMLSGVQAVAYSRIRYVGNGDYERTDRQRKVLEAILTQISDLGATQYPTLVKKLLPYVETSLNATDILKIGASVFTSGIRTLDELRLPSENYSQGEMINGVWYLVFNKEITQEQLRNYLENDIKPE